MKSDTFFQYYNLELPATLSKIEAGYITPEKLETDENGHLMIIYSKTLVAQNSVTKEYEMRIGEVQNWEKLY